MIDHIYCLDLEGTIPKGWPLAMASTINPTSLLQNPSFRAEELEPTESRLFNDSSADHHLSLTAIDHMVINESGNEESPSQTASVTSSSVVVSLGSQADPTLCKSPISCTKNQ